MMKNIAAALSLLLSLSGCSSPPSDETIAEIIHSSMKNDMPISVIGSMLGGKLVKLDEIEIEGIEKKKWTPNAAGKLFGKQAYTYWAVTARVKGTARVAGPFGAKGQLVGFHARHVWGLREEEDGSWTITTDNFTQARPEQPVKRSWWVIDETNKTSTGLSAGGQEL
jgi:starvation-inducible outer membrane lipoprotein